MGVAEGGGEQDEVGPKERALAGKLRVHSGDSRFTITIAAESLCPGVVREKTGGKAWPVGEDPE